MTGTGGISERDRPIRPAGAGGGTPAGSDEALVKRAMRGDAEAFEAIVTRYQDRIYNLIFRMTGSADEAEDLTQETFLKAYRALPGFRRGSQLFTWLYRIAVNAVYSHGRRERRRRETEGISLDAEPVGSEETGGIVSIPDRASPPPDSVLEAADINERVQKAILDLDEEYRSVVLLRDMEGLDYGQIADLIGISRAAVKSRLHRARLELARKLKDLNG
ncbi:MAG: sigma-70 family RNA polymerase sigma factor [Planctomycetota bacterium]|nr:sigma-70 family RNA polymerase sigma factor [Planctomycetota bacterium]